MSKILIDEAVVRQTRATLKTAEAQILALAPVGYIPPALGAIHATNAELGQVLAEAALDKMADNARELGLSYEQPDCDHYWKYIGSKRQAMWECVKCGMYEVPDEQPAPDDHIRDATNMVPPPECKTEAEKTAFAFGWFKALESVREQPAQQDSSWCMKMNGCKTKCEDCPDEVPEQPAPAQEPVIQDWMKPDALCDRSCLYACTEGFTKFPTCVPLTAPAQEPDELTIAYLNGIDTGKKRKPLTDEQIKVIEDGIWKPEFLDDAERLANREFARAIEAAHGITKGTP